MIPLQERERIAEAKERLILISFRIKKAYRRKALELHPDRNYGNVEEATKLFAEVQVAYEVLADPQERAWYDSHSEAFLGTNGGFEGDQHSYNIRITTADDILKIFSKFSPRMEFSDSSTGFFGGLRDQFDQIALEERLACQWEDQEIVDYPSFGSCNDDFETVVRPFYAAWTGFSTRKSFAWKDVYRYSEAPDRRVRRLMEKENRRLRDESIREFNDAVRSLVAFVKKRDPRYKANAQSELQRQETLRQSVAAQAARSRTINQAKMREHVVPQWAQSEEPAAEEDEESSESEIESFECVACHKHFKSQKQFEAHERSKKHLKAVKQLRREMLLQDEELDLEPVSEPDASDQIAAIPHVPESELDKADCVDDEDVQTRIPEMPRAHSQGSFADEVRATGSDRSDSSGPDDDSKSTDEDYASRNTVETRIRADLDALSAAEDPVASLTDDLSTSGLSSRQSVRQPGKAKLKRAKKAARGADQSTELTCANCHAAFASRAKLFAHIKENPNHAQPVASAKSRRR